MHIQKELAIPVISGVVSLSIGLGVGYILGKHFRDEGQVVAFVNDNDDLIFNEESEGQIITSDSIKVIPDMSYDPREDDPEYLRLLAEEEAIEERTSGEVHPLVVDPSETFEKVNVFRNDEDAWDMEAELSTRTPDSPYILHVDEFMENEMEFTQSTVTYYEGDNIMADANDVPVYDWVRIVGDNLRFGYGTSDPNTVYVRNEKEEAEWEILRHHGLYQIEVLGGQFDTDIETEAELRHSRIRFRDE